jgi:two-component system, cell cycle response regulator DivK
MAGERIMIVEDNEQNIKLLGDVLGAYGYRISEARSAEEAIALVPAERPQLVLMDIRLPGLDGVAALRVLRTMPETAVTPVVAVTASVMKEERERLLAVGFDGYIEKPLDIGALPGLVQSFLTSAPVGTRR